jgi:hypothetical protein
LEAFYDGKRNADLGVLLRLMTAECRLLDLSVLSLLPMAWLHLLSSYEMGCVLALWDTQGAKYSS